MERWYEQMKPHYEQLAEKYKIHELHDRLEIARNLKRIRKEMPKSNIVIHGLPQRAQELLATNVESFFFSADSLAKQLYKHPELTTVEYRRILENLKDFDDIFPDGKYRVAMTIYNETWYRVALKTINNRTEVYLLSLHKMGDGSLNKFIESQN